MKANNYKLPKELIPKFDLYYEMADTINKSFPLEIGEDLECFYINAINNDLALGIHRAIIYDEELIVNDIFNNGLLNALGNDIDYTVTIWEKPKLPIFMHEILNASSYRNGATTGAIIVAVPNKDLDNKSNLANPIWFREKHDTRLLPEYIYGYVRVIDEIPQYIIKNPNFKWQHDYQLDGLKYDVRAENGSIRR